MTKNASSAKNIVDYNGRVVRAGDRVDLHRLGVCRIMSVGHPFIRVLQVTTNKRHSVQPYQISLGNKVGR